MEPFCSIVFRKLLFQNVIIVLWRKAIYIFFVCYLVSGDSFDSSTFSVNFLCFFQIVIFYKLITYGSSLFVIFIICAGGFKTVLNHAGISGHSC